MSIAMRENRFFGWVLPACLFAFILFCELSVTASAEPQSAKIGNLYYDLENGHATVMPNEENAYTFRSVSVPETVTFQGQKYVVTQIGDEAFSHCYALRLVRLPKTVTKIGESAFWGCLNLRKSPLTKSVKEIGDLAFADCCMLESIELPEGMKVITNSFFSGCYSLQSVTIPASVEEIEPYAFNECRSLQSVTIPRPMVSIGFYAFKNCYNLQYLCCHAILPPALIPFDAEDATISVFGGLDLATIPLYVPEQYIGLYKESEQWSAFRNIYPIEKGIVARKKIPETTDCMFIEGLFYKLDPKNRTAEVVPMSIYGNRSERQTVMDTVDIPAQVKYKGRSYKVNRIGERAFYDLDVKKVVIPNTVTTIGEQAFNSCLYLKSVTLPPLLDTIEEGAFGNCAFQSIDFPRNLKYIGEDAFSNCGYMEEFNIPASVEYVANDAFSYCNKLKSIHVMEGNPNYCSIGGALYSADTTRLIYCPDMLGYVNIPARVSVIDTFAFNGFSGSLYVNKENPNYSTASWVLYNKEKTKVIRFISNSLDDWRVVRTENIFSCDVPEGVIEIADYAFFGCDNMWTVDLPHSLTTIGNHSFACAFDLREIKMGENITSIGESAFWGCYSLTSFTFPASLKYIGNDALNGCYKITDIYNNAPVPQTYPDILGIDESSCTLHVPAESLELYQSASGWNKFGTIVPIE